MEETKKMTTTDLLREQSIEAATVVRLEPAFKPFDRVLVRDGDGEEWRIEFFDSYHEVEKFPYMCLTARYAQCIPYDDDTKYLLGMNGKPTAQVGQRFPLYEMVMRWKEDKK